MKTTLLPFQKNKFLWAAAFLTLLCLFTFTTYASAAEFAVVYGTDQLNLRAQPSSSSQWLGAYPKGSWIEISPGTDQWYQAKTMDGKQGYMSKNYLTTGNTQVLTIGYTANPAPSAFTNLRQSADYNSGVIARYYNGVPAVVLGQLNGWYQVNINGTVGYMRSEFLQVSTMVGSSDLATIVTPGNTPLNLRYGPSTAYASMKQFNGGRYVMVLNRGNGWWQVSIDGYVGFMDVNFLRNGLQGTGGGNGGGTGDGSTGGGTNPSADAYALVKNPGANQILNLREQPSQTARSIGQYKTNTKVTILQQGVQWSKVKVNATGKIGWMMSRYLQLYNLPAAPVKTISQPNGTFVNLRKGESLNSAVLTRLNHGTPVTVLVPGGQWTKVQYNGYVGYVLSNFLK